MNLQKFDKYLADDKSVDESSNEKKTQMYRDGSYSLRSAFNEFSSYYMKSLGQMMQGKAVMNPKYKKLRDAIATAYERMDDAISKHMEIMNKDAEEERQRDQKDKI